MGRTKILVDKCLWALMLAAVVGCGGKSQTVVSSGGTGGDGEGGTMTGGGGTGGGSGGKSGGKAGTGGGGSGAGGGSSANGGGSGVSGAGTGGVASNVYIGEVRVDAVNKVDLLFVVDNSIAMADKQQILAAAVPRFVNRLVSPPCVDENGNETGDSAPCPAGGAPAFPPLQDIHVGVITSSLGDHGSADVCSEASVVSGSDTTYNDRAQFVPTVYNTLPGRSGLESWNGTGFLVWDPREAAPGSIPHSPPGMDDAEQFAGAIRDHVVAVGEHGCGYEAPLEAWYRFLVDPEPVDSLTNNGAVTVRGPVNQTVLAQRAAFLRPDSLLAIVMLTDENDCSIVDEEGTQGWLVPYKGGVLVNNWRMPRAHQICLTDPNDPNCAPCGGGDSDPGCMGGAPLTPAEDAPNIRCYRQKQRFGIDLLYPTQRYVDALTRPTIDPRYRGELVPNPLFASTGGGKMRDPSLVTLLGIVGVPWQDLADEESLSDPRRLRYLSAGDLADSGRWPILLGDPYEAVEPLDPFMIESVDPRPTGAPHPLVGVSITPPESMTLNIINGHEQAVIAAERADLQHACIFPLPTPVLCDSSNDGACDCNVDEYQKQSPLCRYDSPNEDGIQEFAKAYPSLRPLSVLQGLGSNAVVASICPKNATAEGTPDTDPDYGYNPAFTALYERMRQAFVMPCLPRPLVLDPNSPTGTSVGCRMIEVVPFAGCGCDPAFGRAPLDDEPDIAPAVESYLAQAGYCGQTGLPSCDSFCSCEIAQLAGDALTACQNDPTSSADTYGFCYVDPDAGVGSPELVASCPATQKRILRFQGEGVPAPDAFVLFACE